MPKHARRFETLPEYPLATIPQKKRTLLERGVDVIDLGAGDADLAPPARALETLARASHVPTMSRYGFGLGFVGYREAISKWMTQRFGMTFNPMTEIVPLIGSKEGISHLALAYLEPGAVGIIPEPGYNAYQGGTLLASGEPYRYALRPRTNFLVDLDEIPDDVLRRARLLYLNYPNNPTAAIAPRDYLEKVVARCRELDILLVYDNAYSELTYDGYVAPSIFEIPGARDVAIEFFSLSKSYSMTGWRIGFAVGAAPLIGALTRVKSYTDTGPWLAIQQAAIAALDNSDALVAPVRAELQRRRDAAVRALTANGFTCESPSAAMYLWIPLPPGVEAKAFAMKAMEETGVVVLPGSGFGPAGEGFFRIALTVGAPRLEEAATRLGKVLAEVRRGALAAAR